eukprot:CAMPEP_0185569302 /NCGR_PEP_ID=MMETSP0434-20130131/1965_1 /TAXON_ID=626734 ORGANISM="Favella taraikaensis, Strain Fe Narragansett Bay" /NCGR_SAMPLE_ID=MMETSP0434 /ASSEMBLY_ACC=CAM_ASM_000379 /LENGTH=99 /DNA_ID=CAMNT_0028184043 /DNA_START=1305 /DNA_END=1604 /DNA_ORIENTATION=+
MPSSMQLTVVFVLPMSITQAVYAAIAYVAITASWCTKADLKPILTKSMLRMWRTWCLMKESGMIRTTLKLLSLSAARPILSLIEASRILWMSSMHMLAV